MSWKAIGYVTKKEFVNGLIKTESSYKDLTEDENKIVDNVLDYLEESYMGDNDSIILSGGGDYSSASAEIDMVIENYKDDGEDIPEKFVKAFNLFEDYSDYSFLEQFRNKLKKVKKE